MNGYGNGTDTVKNKSSIISIKIKTLIEQLLLYIPCERSLLKHFQGCKLTLIDNDFEQAANGIEHVAIITIYYQQILYGVLRIRQKTVVKFISFS